MSKIIKILLIKPGVRPVAIDILDTLDAMQALVGGSIEAVYPFEDCVAIVCNDCGKFNGMLPNRALVTDSGEVYDLIYGPFFICDASGEDFDSLSDELMEKYTKIFWAPEFYIPDTIIREGEYDENS